jgi:hypothetical protein
MNAIWILEQRYRERKKGKWSPWDLCYGANFYSLRPTDREMSDTYMQRRAVEFHRIEEPDKP